MDMSEEQFYARILRESAGAQDLENTALQTLCEPAQSKCTWTSRKSHFIRIYSKNAGDQMEHPDLTPVF